MHKVVEAWVFAHIQLTPEEVAAYKGSPVVYYGDYGFFLEPNEYAIFSHSNIKEPRNRHNAKDLYAGTALLNSAMGSPGSLTSRHIILMALHLPSWFPFLDRIPIIRQIPT